MSWLAFVWLLLTGVGMVHCAIPRARLAEKIGLAFPLSAGLHALIDFSLMEAWHARVFWSALILSPFLIFVVAVRPRWNNEKWTWKDAAALLLILAALSQVWTHVVITPVSEWDAISMWLFKGKVIAIEGRLTRHEAMRFRDVQPSYPWNVPLMHAWFGRVKGRFSEDAAKGIVFMFFCSLLLILYSLARLRWERGKSLIFIAAYVLIPFALVGAFNRDADLILETLIATTIFLSLLLQIRPEPRAPILLAIAIFLTCWTKVEGILFSLLFCTCLVVTEFVAPGVKKRSLLIAAVVGLTAGIFAVWIPKYLFGSAAWFMDRATIPGEMLPRAAAIFGIMLMEMFNGWKWNFTWWLAPLLLLTRRDPYRLKWLFFGQLALYFLSYFFSPYPLEWHMSTSLSRVLLHVLPALFAWTVFAWPGTRPKSNRANM